MVPRAKSLGLNTVYGTCCVHESKLTGRIGSVQSFDQRTHICDLCTGDVVARSFNEKFEKRKFVVINRQQ